MRQTVVLPIRACRAMSPCDSPAPCAVFRHRRQRALLYEPPIRVMAARPSSRRIPFGLLVLLAQWGESAMEGRGATNLLLAVIAGVLLFGKEAMLGGLQGFFIVAVAIGVIWGVLSLAFFLIRQTVNEFREAKDWTEVGSVIFFIAFCCIGVPMLAYAGWLWLEGTERPVKAALDSGIGIAWMVVFGLFTCGVAVAALQHSLRWLRANWQHWPDYLMQGMRGLGTMLVAPFVFPVREWRFKRDGGSGVVMSFFSSVYAGLFGLALWMVMLLAVTFALLGLGVMD